MDATTVSAILSGGAALLGASVGATATYLTARNQHKRLAAKEREDRRHELERDSARECEQLCVLIAEIMETEQHPAHERPNAETLDRHERLRESHSKLNVAALYLPDGLRERVKMLGDIVAHSAELSYGGPLGLPCHYDLPYTICWNVKHEIRALVAAFLRDSSQQLPEPRPKISEYAAALNDLNSQRQEYYEMVDEHDEDSKRRQRNKEDFYKAHPDLRP